MWRCSEGRAAPYPLQPTPSFAHEATEVVSGDRCGCYADPTATMGVPGALCLDSEITTITVHYLPKDYTNPPTGE